MEVSDYGFLGLAYSMCNLKFEIYTRDADIALVFPRTHTPVRDCNPRTASGN